MKKIIVYTFVLLAALPITINAQNREGAKTILDKTFSLYKTATGVKLTFRSQIKESTGTSYEPIRGVAQLKGNRFKIEMDEATAWFDGKTQWVLRNEVQEVYISNPTGEELVAISPLSLLSIYQEGYDFSYPETVEVNAISAYKIELKAKNNDKDFSNISLFVNSSDYSISRLITTTEQGTKTELDLFDQKFNENFSDAMFVYNPNEYPEVEIVDLR